MDTQAAALTEQHRQAQLAIRAQALRDFALIWPIWKGDQASFGRLVAAATTLVRAYRQISAAAGAAYFQAFRDAAGTAGASAPVFAAAIDDAKVATSLYATGHDAVRVALQAGQQPEQARATAFVRSSGALTRHVIDAGRQTVIESVQADREALGWARVTDGDPCYFCLTLASRGAVYKTEQTGSFEAHDHCGCTVMPIYNGVALPAKTAEWRRIYDDAQRQGVESGDLHPDENSSAARLNAVRRYMAAQAA